DIDPGLVEDSREGIIIGRQHRDGRSCGLHPRQVSYTDLFLCHTSVHPKKIRSRLNRQPRTFVRAPESAQASFGVPVRFEDPGTSPSQHIPCAPSGALLKFCRGEVNHDEAKMFSLISQNSKAREVSLGGAG